MFPGGYIESWGRGTIKVLEECEKHGLPEPLIEERGGGVSVTFFKGVSLEDFIANLDLDDRRLKAIQYVKENKRITNGVYQEINSVSDRTALRDLEDLTLNGVFFKIGEKRGVRYELRKRFLV